MNFFFSSILRVLWHVLIASVIVRKFCQTKVQYCSSNMCAASLHGMGVQFIFQYVCPQVRTEWNLPYVAKLVYRAIVLARSADTTRAISFFRCRSLCWSSFFHRHRAKWIFAFALFIRSDELSVGRSVGRRSIGCSFAVCVTLACFNSEFIFLRRAYTASIWYSFLFYSLSLSTARALHLFLLPLPLKLIDILECAPTI